MMGIRRKKGREMAMGEGRRGGEERRGDGRHTSPAQEEQHRLQLVCWRRQRA